MGGGVVDSSHGARRMRGVGRAAGTGGGEDHRHRGGDNGWAGGREGGRTRGREDNIDTELS